VPWDLDALFRLLLQCVNHRDDASEPDRTASHARVSAISPRMSRASTHLTSAMAASAFHVGGDGGLRAPGGPRNARGLRARVPHGVTARRVPVGRFASAGDARDNGWRVPGGLQRMDDRVPWLAVAIFVLSVVSRSVSARRLLAPGARVRITGPTLDVLKEKGTLEWVRGDSLRSGGRTIAIADATEIEVGTSVSNFPLFAGLGLVGGAVLAGTLCLLDCSASSSDVDHGTWVLLFAGGGAAAGLAAGIVGGALTYRTRWRSVRSERLGLCRRRGPIRSPTPGQVRHDAAAHLATPLRVSAAWVDSWPTQCVTGTRRCSRLSSSATALRYRCRPWRSCHISCRRLRPGDPGRRRSTSSRSARHRLV
jgi:hypothetical protein